MLTNLLNILIRIGLRRSLFFLGGVFLTVAVPSLIIANKVSIQEPIDLQPAEVVQRLQQDYPNWKEGLPPCPCTITDAEKQNDKFVEDYIGPKADKSGLTNYHPGAARSFRSKTPKKYSLEGRKDLFPLMPGQQCTYDIDGKLITHGPGAGTPDAYGSEGTDNYFFTTIGNFIASGKFERSGLHKTWDEKTYHALGWKEYHKIWTPNNGNKCSFNPSPATPQELKQVSKLIFPKGWRVQQDGRNVYYEHWLDTIRVFRNDDLNGFPRKLYEVKTRMIFQQEGQRDKTEKKSKVWVQCSKNNPLVIHHPELGYHPDSVMTDSDNPIMEVVPIAPGSFVPMVRIWDNGLFWAVCHELSEIDYSFYESENAKQYGYSPGLEDQSYEALTQEEFIQAIYR